MTLIRRYFLDWISSGSGGGGTSTLWAGTISGTGVQSTGIQAFLDAWQVVADSQYTATLQEVADIVEDTTGLKVGEDPVPAGVTAAGVVAGEPLPDQTQLCISFRTNAFVAGRRLRGRMYVPGISSTINIGGEPDLPAVQPLAAALPFNSQLIYSQTHLVSATVNDVSLFPEWAVLRRRRD